MAQKKKKPKVVLKKNQVIILYSYSHLKTRLVIDKCRTLTMINYIVSLFILQGKI